MNEHASSRSRFSGIWLWVLIVLQVISLWMDASHRVIMKLYAPTSGTQAALQDPQSSTNTSIESIDTVLESARISTAATDDKIHTKNTTATVLPSPPDAPERETTLHHESPSDSFSTFSACLLIMDDNYRLDEWIAYHWYVMPLRYLVVAVDPKSKTSPTEIFDKWRDFGMTIVEWTDDDYLLPFLGVEELEDTKNKSFKMLAVHRKRQEVFYSECTRHLMNATAKGSNEARSWTMYIDIDEYVTINMDIATEEDGNLLKQPGSIRKMLHKYKEHPLDVDEHLKAGGNLTKTEQGWYRHFAKFGTCMAFARAPYSAIESSKEERAKDVPTGFTLDPARLDTLRFRYRGKPRYRKDGPGKAFVDVAKVKVEDLGPVNAHKPLKICPQPEDGYKDAPIGIHHYLGSWEAYSYRDDARRGSFKNFDDWKTRAILDKGGADDELRPWLSGFVKAVGLEKANTLLQSAGLPIQAKQTLVMYNGTAPVVFEGDLRSLQR